MEKDVEWKKETLTEIKVFTRWAISSLLDGAFIALWVVIQWGAQQIIENFPLSGIDTWVLRVFQVVFAITTLAPILIYIYVDIMVMFIRARRRVRDEWEKDRDDASNANQEGSSD